MKKEIILNQRAKKTHREQIKLMFLEDDVGANEIYLVGQLHDIYKVAFVNRNSKESLTFELKLHDEGGIAGNPPFESNELVRIVSPAEAKKLLKKCSYKYSSGEKIPRPHKETLKKVLKLLSYRN